MSKPRTFQELATKAHDMEVTIASRVIHSFSFAELKSAKAEFKRTIEFVKNLTKEAMFIFKADRSKFREG